MGKASAGQLRPAGEQRAGRAAEAKRSRPGLNRSLVAARRRRLLTRAAPLAVIAVLAFAGGLIVGGRSPELEAANRFLEAWEARDYEAMHAELTGPAAAEYDPGELASLYERAATTASATSVDPGEPEGPTDVADESVVRAPVRVTTHAFGTLSAPLEIPVEDGAIGWEPHLVFPGLGEGEELARRTRAPERAAILARGGTPLAEGPAAARSSPLGAAAQNVAGTMGVPKREDAERIEALGFPPGTLVGESGLERAFDQRLAGRPGGQLIAMPAEGQPRVLASSEPQPGEPVRTTIDPTLQEAAVAALGDRFGGVAVLDTRNGAVRALAGVAFSAPQPPGSTFKVITTVAALEDGLVRLDEEFPVQTSTSELGREISNAHDEPCGGTFVESFAHSCNTVFAPLGAEVGGVKLVEVAERFGFNSRPQLFNQEATQVVDPPASTIPEQLESELEVGVSAIGQGEVLATPLQLASVSQTIAAEGVRHPTPLVRDPALAPPAEPVRVTDARTSATVRDLMVEVVESGTGTAAGLPGIRVAGKTGTAELGPDPDAPAPPPGEQPPQEVDAWFTSFAPADDARLAVAVMVVDAEGGGGEVAAPIAREVLAAGL
jgi:peptidoglycan glycosyltransferase